MAVDRASGTYYERLAKGWERWVAAAVVVVLLVPLPFVRFEGWPSGNLLWHHPLTPWSRFRLCYLSFPERVPVNDRFGFRWDGWTLKPEPLFDRPLAVSADGEALFQWQERPEMSLAALDARGDLLMVRTGWQPLLFWPLRMLREAARGDLGIPPGAAARRQAAAATTPERDLGQPLGSPGASGGRGSGSKSGSGPDP